MVKRDPMATGKQERLEAEAIVIGGGVVGCAIASELASDRSLLLLEGERRLGEGITSRNSGVIHSGLYYAKGSLKALTCVEGNRLLYPWAAARGVGHAKIGKLVVARDEDLAALEALERNARECGAPGIELVARDFIRAKEPTLEAAAALWCPESGIVDAVELARSFAADAAAKGAAVVTSARVLAIERAAAGFLLQTERGEIACAQLVNAAGLHADEIAALAGVSKYRIRPCRGDYFRLATKVRYRHLVYPVRRPGSLGLGIHLTLDLSSRARLGPDSEFVESKSDFSSREEKLPAFLEAGRRLLGDIDPGQLSYDSCGIRPKLEGETDFVVSRDLPGLVNLVGIESPGLTASLALARRVRDLLD
jgi:L-2-hydroxyglutarate oxidase LhgO